MAMLSCSCYESVDAMDVVDSPVCRLLKQE